MRRRRQPRRERHRRCETLPETSTQDSTTADARDSAMRRRGPRRRRRHGHRRPARMSGRGRLRARHVRHERCLHREPRRHRRRRRQVPGTRRREQQRAHQRARVRRVGEHAASPVATRLAHGTQAYIRADGPTIASSYVDLTDGNLQNGISVDEKGGNRSGVGAWTGTNSGGATYSGSSCLDWMVGIAGAKGDIGNVGGNGSGWSSLTDRRLQRAPQPVLRREVGRRSLRSWKSRRASSTADRRDGRRRGRSVRCRSRGPSRCHRGLLCAVGRAGRRSSSPP